MNIVTLTLNPCIDRTLWVEEHGEKPYSVDLETGGKGINVARVLGRLGVSAVAVCPVGGETGAQFLALAESEGITVAPVKATAPMRVIDTWVRRRDFDQRVDYAKGGPLTEEELDALESTLFAQLENAEALAICGSASCEAAARRVPGIIRRAQKMGVRVLLDSNGPALTLGAAACPDLIKPNEDELHALTGIKDDPSAAAQKLLEAGVGGVIASLGRAGCMWAGPGFEEYCPSPRVETVNAVGSGDSFVAGFLFASFKGYAPQTALMIACAAGAANAAMFPAARIGREDVEALLGWKLG